MNRRRTPHSPPHPWMFSEVGELEERREGVVVSRPSRRSFLASLALTTAATSVRIGAADRGPRTPIGLQMYSVRDEEKQHRLGTLEALGKMGYETVEFWSPYSSWTLDYAREVRRKLDGLGLKCHSNHTSAEDFTEPKLARIAELNQILGSRWVIMAHAGPQPDLDGWKKTAETLSRASTQLRAQGLKVGYHNWDVDFRPVGSVRPIDILTGNTPSEVGFQLDVATCLAAGADPLAFIRANVGRIKSYHLKDWSSDSQKQYRVLLGEGDGNWKELLRLAESVGGVEHYLIEQEGSRFPPLETARRCLVNYKTIRG